MDSRRQGRGPKRTQGDRIIPAPLLSALVVVFLLAASQATLLTPAHAAPAKGPQPVGALPSSSAPGAALPYAVGDFFAAPPSPTHHSADPPAARVSFDPARSKVVDAETTPTKLVYANPDGSHTAVVSAVPVRVRDQTGAWQAIDRTVVATPAGALAPKAAPEAVSFGRLATGVLASVALPGGAVVARHPDALPVAGTPAGDSATYPKALPGGRDLVVRPIAGGFTESVVLANATAAPSYLVELVLPAGMQASQVGTDVQLSDAAGTPIATFGSGLAFDASWSSGATPVTAPVSVRLVSQAAGLATVEVGVDPAWLVSPARRFPVTIDPTFSQLSNASGAFDTWVYSGPEYANTSYASQPWLVVGSADGGAHVTRSLLRFDLSSLPTGANVAVTDAKLRLFEWYSYAGSCAKRDVQIQGLAAAPNAATTWANQPAVDGAGVVSTSSFAHFQGTGSACPEANESLDVLSLARRWLTNGATNNGLQVRAASETDPYAYKAFLSAVGSSDPNVVPKLTITYNRPPGVATLYGPSSGAQLTSPTPILAANLASDPDGDPVQYWFRATTGTDAESGAKVVDSGWLSPNAANNCGTGGVVVICYTVPFGALQDGETYSWHVLTWDGFASGASGSYTYPGPSDTRSLTVDFHLGMDAPAPRDQMGPVTVNLASGNALLAHASPAYPAVGGPMGLSFVYNSQAITGTTGLIGSYYDDPTGSRSFANKTPVMVRTDPTVNFNWGSDSPSPGIGADNFLVRWTGKLTLPDPGAAVTDDKLNYQFYTANDDGVRVWVNGTNVVDRWQDESNLWNTGCGGCPSIHLARNTAVDITVEYYDHSGPAYLTLGVC